MIIDWLKQLLTRQDKTPRTQHNYKCVKCETVYEDTPEEPCCYEFGTYYATFDEPTQHI